MAILAGHLLSLGRQLGFHVSLTAPQQIGRYEISQHHRTLVRSRHLQARCPIPIGRRLISIVAYPLSRSARSPRCREEAGMMARYQVAKLIRKTPSTMRCTHLACADVVWYPAFLMSMPQITSEVGVFRGQASRCNCCKYYHVAIVTSNPILLS